jgi:hypothetical protein
MHLLNRQVHFTLLSILATITRKSRMKNWIPYLAKSSKRILSFPCRLDKEQFITREAEILSFQADVVPEIAPYDFIAQRNLAECARLLT